MGLDIQKFPVYKNAATVTAYSNIRSITQDKNDGKYTLNGFGHILTNSINIDTLYLEIKSDEPFVNDWEVLYLELKRLLTERGIEFTDV